MAHSERRSGIVKEVVSEECRGTGGGKNERGAVL
jgi:hypothetical protein